jgi:hypothetical protein
MLRATDYMLTAEELRLRRRKRRLWLVIAFVLLLGIVGAFLGGRPTLHAIKAWQARRHAQKAFALIEQEKWNEARDEATAAYQLYPKEPEALRAIARFLTRIRNPEALEFWKQLRDAVPLTREDLRDEATIALISGEMDRAAAAVNRLTRGDKNPAPTDWLLAAQAALQKNAPQEALNAIEKIFSDQKTTERETLQAAVLELQAANFTDLTSRDNQQNEALSRIAKVAQGKNDAALDALVLLGQRALSNQKSEVRDQKSEVRDQKSEGEVARALENHPLAKAPQKLLALDLQMHADPAKKNALTDQAIRDWKDADATSLATLAMWLNGHGEYQRELETIPLEKARQTRDLFLQDVDALGALGRWGEIKQLLNSEGFPLDPVIQQMYLARCTAQLGEKTAAENNWKRALEVAAHDVKKLIGLADYAEKNGALDIAEAAYNSAATELPKFRPAQQGRLRMAQANRDTKKIHAVLAEMLNIWPNDTAIQNDEAYTRLLLLPNDSTLNSQPPASGELAQIEQLAERLIKREPNSLPHRTLLALARIRAGLPASALDAYGIQVPDQALTASAIAVRCAALMANGRMDEAKSLISGLRRDQLLLEERALINLK